MTEKCPDPIPTSSRMPQCKGQKAVQWDPFGCLRQPGEVAKQTGAAGGGRGARTHNPRRGFARLFVWAAQQMWCGLCFAVIPCVRAYHAGRLSGDSNTAPVELPDPRPMRGSSLFAYTVSRQHSAALGALGDAFVRLPEFLFFVYVE